MRETLYSCLSPRCFCARAAAHFFIGISLAFAAGAVGAEEHVSGQNAWSYHGNTGPEHWGNLSSASSLCAKGMRQSPVDFIAEASMGLYKPFAFDYRTTHFQVVNNGHTVEGHATESRNRLDYGSSMFVLEQFHMHAPSEHSFEGRHYPLEIHLVHRSASGEVTVLAVLVLQGHENRALADLFRNLPARTHDEIAVTLNTEVFLPHTQEAFEYIGSLTTPPCTENVNWIVLRQPIELSEEQIKAFRSLYSENRRPVQPLHQRIVSKN
ncbi:MAG: carbonic anhydrase family protein [Zoogloeaceae bacterium]|jgi:carbonic anhydrase|nr:carbonic anhydrase family protein [Zoogloeaceae bacterium]